MKFQRVAELNVRCSLPLRNLNSPGAAFSDCCGRAARFAVIMENGSKMWRCAEHQNIRRIETGPSVTYIESN